MEFPAILRRLVFAACAVAAAVLSGVLSAPAAAPANGPTDPAKFPPDQIEYFEKHVRPLLTKHCIECHGPKLQEAGLRLDGRTHILAGAEGHPAAVPGDPNKSLIIAVTKYDGDVQMPPDGKLPADQLAALTNWVKLGLPWPEESKLAKADTAGTAAATNTATMPPASTAWSGSMDERIARARSDHWAFQPVRRSEAPKVAHLAWNARPIDRFVYAKLAEKSIRPAPPADPRTLIRRVYFDLVGIPPTPEEADAFVAAYTASPSATLPISHPTAKGGEAERQSGGETEKDDKDARSYAQPLRPSAPQPPATTGGTERQRDGEKVYEELIDRLLASPLYGERWARHWLDVARYGDTKGYAFTMERRFPFAYTYRDYVIRAFNDDKPYDQFLLEQLAADKLPNSDPKSLAALGFLTCGRQFTGIHDTVDDQIDVVTRGLLGLTTACARCHDHKFDPIPTADYYSLYGVFRSSIAPAEYPLLGEPEPSPEYDAYLKEHQKLSAERDAFVNDATAKVLDELRSRAGDYLTKTVLDSLDKAGSKEKDVLLDPGDLRPTVVRRWRDMLIRTKRDKSPLFVAWHRLDDVPETEFEKRAPAVIAELTKDGKLNGLLREGLTKQTPKSMLDVAKLYGDLFARSNTEWKKAIDPKSRRPNEVGANEPSPTKLADVALEEFRAVLFAGDAPTSLGMDLTHQVFDRKVRGQVDALQKKVDSLTVTSPGAPPRAMSLVDNPQLYNPVIFVRGDAARRGPDVPRRSLSILSGPDRKPFADGSGRLGLAREIVNRENPLTARVMVNRIWLHHFGSGLVETASDFGVRTAPPTHPELLDWLAAEFMDEGWSIKRLHREIMLSQAYRQSSIYPTSVAGTALPAGRPAGSAESALTLTSNSNAYSVDPENRLLWRMNRKRIELESMRDAMLAVAGRLDTKPFGRPIDLWKQPFTTRRAVYGYIDRQDLPGIFGVFDFANPDVTIDQRSRTTVPQQALFAMNSPFVQEQARKLAARPEIAGAKSDAERITGLYRTALDRPPTADELGRMQQFLAEVGAAKPPVETWQYGYGEYDLAAGPMKNGAVKSFTPLKHWTGKEWQVGPKIPDDKLGHIIVRPNSGHAGRSLKATNIVRWTSPIDGVVSLTGELKHPNKEGDGIAAHAVSSQLGKLGNWAAHNGAAKTNVARIEVARGDSIDLVIEPRVTGSFDGYLWVPEIRRIDGLPTAWNFEKDFHGPSAPPMTGLEIAAQVLLMSNEFMFVD